MLCERLGSEEGEDDLYRDSEKNVLDSEDSVLRRWREYFHDLKNEKQITNGSQGISK